MKNIHYIALSALALAGLAACEEDHDFPVTDQGPEMTVVSYSQKAAMGSTIQFEVTLNDRLPLSTLKAELYFDEEKVADTELRTKENGPYTGCVQVPYYADLPDGTATLKMIGQNNQFGLTVQDLDVAVVRPNPAYLTFVTTDGKEMRADRTDANYVYALTAELPQAISGYFKTPAIDDAGTELTFGWDAANKKLTAGSTEPIPYTYLNAGEWTIKADIKTFATEPFLVPVKFGGKYMETVDNGYALVLDLEEGSTYALEGIDGSGDYAGDVDYFTKDGNDLKCTVPSGSYRVVVDTKHQYVTAEVYKDGQPASLQADGTGAIWIVGEKVGKPSLENEVGWNTSKALCMAPVEPGKYRITLVAGQSVGASAVNFKFFGGAKSWDNALTHDKLTTSSTIIGIGTGAEDETGEKHDDGNLYMKPNMSFEEGKAYTFTIDVTAGVDNGVLTVAEKSETGDTDPYLVEIAQVDENTLAATLNLTQGKLIKLAGFDLSQWWIDDNFLAPDANGTLTVKVVDGKYRITAKKDVKRIHVQRVNADGSEVTVNDDGTGGIWLMGWGVGAPSQDHQFGFDPGKAYCMAEVAPAVYRLTGKAGPEKGSATGDYFRYDYISMKFFHQNGWGGEMKNPTLAPGTEKLLKAGGNLELADGVQLEEGAVYEFTVDLTGGKDKPVITFRKK